VAEKRRHLDEEVVIERLDFVSTALEIPRIGAELLQVQEGHAPGDASLDGAQFIGGEIDPTRPLQQPENPVPRLLIAQNGWGYPWSAAGASAT
jgi:hypothetical protein